MATHFVACADGALLIERGKEKLGKFVPHRWRAILAWRIVYSDDFDGAPPSPMVYPVTLEPIDWSRRDDWALSYPGSMVYMPDGTQLTGGVMELEERWSKMPAPSKGESP